jgi:hypothetical protein
VDREDVIQILHETGRLKRYVLQTFHSGKTLSPDFLQVPSYPREYLEKLAVDIRRGDLAEEVSVRL